MPPEPRPVQATQTTGGETQIGAAGADVQASQRRLDELNKQLAVAQEKVRESIAALGETPMLPGTPGTPETTDTTANPIDYRPRLGPDGKQLIGPDGKGLTEPVYPTKPGKAPGAEEPDPRAVAQANAALAEARAQETRIYEEIAAEKISYKEAITAQRAAEGTPLSHDDQLLLDAQIAIAQTNVETAGYEARSAALQVQADEAAARGDVSAAEQYTRDRQAMLDERDARATAFDEAYDTAEQALRQAGDERIAELHPYAVAQAEAQGRVDEVEATKAERLLESDIDLALANLEWQLTENKISQQEYEKNKRILDAGGPEADVLATQLANDHQAITNQQTAEGDPVTKLNQMKDAIAAGRMTTKQADLMATEYLTGETLAQRQNTIDTNLGNLAQSALERGLYVSPGQTSFDPSGDLQAGMAGLGMQYTPQQFTPRSVPQWMEDIGQNTDVNMGVGQTFTEDGGWAAGVGGGQPIDARSMPKDMVARMSRGEAPPAVAVNGSSQGASPSTNAPVTINIGGGPSSAPQPVSAAGAPPPPVVKTAGGPPPPNMAQGPRRYGQGNPNAWYRSIAGAA